jgi:hypothetical protein
MITLIILIVLVVGYATYKHVTINEIKDIVAKYEPSVVSEVQKLIAELKAKL